MVTNYVLMNETLVELPIPPLVKLILDLSPEHIV